MKNPSIYYMGDQPYDSYDEYLEELFTAMDVYLLMSVQRELKNFSIRNNERQTRLLKEADASLRRRLSEKGLEEEQVYEDWKKMIEDRRSFTEEIGRELLLEKLIEKTGGGDFVRNTVILSVMLALHSEYRKILRALLPELEEKPDIGMCVQLFSPNAAVSERFLYLAVHQYKRSLCVLFPSLEEAENIREAFVWCDTRLTDILMGSSIYLPAGVSLYEQETECPELFFREAECSRIEKLLEEQKMPVVMLWGGCGSGKKHLLTTVAHRQKRSIVFYDLSGNYEPEAGIEPLKSELRYVIRECVLFGHMLAVTSFGELAKKHQEELAVWLDTAAHSRVSEIFILNRTEDYRNYVSCVFDIELKPLDAPQRIELWKYFLEGKEVEDGLNREALANTFQITPGQMEAAVRQAELMGGGRFSEKLLYQACYIQLSHGLEEKAARIKPAFQWEDLKLAAEDKEVLRDVCSCVRNRHTVLNKWKFEKVVPYGGGITVLFSGPPGTGKTMAAQVIAAELHMELYKIDLSQVIDKYVGETEKNIRHIFEQAKKSNSVLFFDEADSIFNKRLEASGANERFANIESSLLLQCIEEYSGITILATNNFSSIDGAFIRRFKYYLLFKEPDEQIRYEIWKSVIPEEAPLSEEVDLKELAHIFEFTGAVIKNVVLSAAYLAAAEKREIMLADILKSIRREMTKNNLVLTKEKMGSLGYMFDEMMEVSYREGE